jgi:hypothetical protein
MKQSVFHYFRVNVVKSEHCLDFVSLKEFCRFLEVNHIKSVFMINDANSQASHFAVAQNGGLLRKTTDGFKQLEDFLHAEQQHFPDSETYYDAQERGYVAYEDYRLVVEAGINDKQVFETLKSQGYIKGFAEYEKQKTEVPALPDIGETKNPYDLYRYAERQGFVSYFDFSEAWKKGFTEAATYKIASERGYKTKDDYEAGLKGGFHGAADYEKAKELKVRDKEDFDKLIELEFLAHTGYMYDQRVMLVLISKLPQSKKVGINKLTDLFNETKEAYRYEDTKEMPAWFTCAFSDRNSIIDFLSTSDFVKKYGTYDKDGEYFETNRLQSRKVVIDASNVAHNSHANGHGKPQIANVIKLAEELKKRGFTEMTIIADANLRHKVTDKELIKQLKEMGEYLESPSERPADIFIIQYVKRHCCLLISNDTFKEWKAQDQWVALNIDYYRLAFLINKEGVILPDLTN